VATISAMSDYNGAPGGGALPDDSYFYAGPDDSFADYSNFSASVVPDNPVQSPGKAIDLMLPGTQIWSTWYDGSNVESNGTSMAAPHAAGMAALLIAENGTDFNNDGVRDASDVYAIRQTMITTAIAQDDPDRGLAVLNDPDGNWEPIGWAGPLGPVNTSPVAFDDSYSVTEDTTLTASVGDTDSPGVLDNDTDAEGDPLEAMLVTPPENGTLVLQADGSFTYTPDADYFGTDSFTYRAFDGNSSSAAATATIVVNAVPGDPPVADAGGPYSAVVGAEVQFDASGTTDPDLPGDTLTYTWDFGDGTAPVSGEEPTISHTYTTAQSYEVTLTVEDSLSLTDTATATVTVTEAATEEIFENTTSLTIADAHPRKGARTTSSQILAEPAVADTRIESLTLVVSLDDGTSDVSDLTALLTSPQGSSKAVTPLVSGTMTFSDFGFVDEIVYGTWTLTFSDALRGGTHVLNSWQLIVVPALGGLSPAQAAAADATLADESVLSAASALNLAQLDWAESTPNDRDLVAKPALHDLALLLFE